MVAAPVAAGYAAAVGACGVAGVVGEAGAGLSSVAGFAGAGEAEWAAAGAALPEAVDAVEAVEASGGMGAIGAIGAIEGAEAVAAASSAAAKAASIGSVPEVAPPAASLSVGLAGRVLIFGSTFWIKVRGRVGRRGGKAVVRRATGAGGAATPVRRTCGGAPSGVESSMMTSRGEASFLPARIACRISLSTAASSPSTRTPMERSLNTRSWCETPIIVARSVTRIFPIGAVVLLADPA